MLVFAIRYQLMTDSSILGALESFSTCLAPGSLNPEISTESLGELTMRLLQELMQTRQDLESERCQRIELQKRLKLLLDGLVCESPDRAANNHESELNSFERASHAYLPASGSPSSDLVGARNIEAFWSLPDCKNKIPTESNSPPHPLLRPCANRRKTEDKETTPGSSSPPTPEISSETPRLNLLEALGILSPADELRIVTVRRVHKLGFKSALILRQFFARFGQVIDVVLLPMRSRPKASADGNLRGARPSSMGFIVMSSAAEAQVALKQPTIEIKGWPIEVRAFVRPADREDLL